MTSSKAWAYKKLSITNEKYRNNYDRIFSKGMDLGDSELCRIVESKNSVEVEYCFNISDVKDNWKKTFQQG